MKAMRGSATVLLVLMAMACGSTTATGATHVVVEAVSGGWNYALALKSDGSVWSWGANDDGELGDGGIGATNILVPAPIKSLTHGVIAIAAGWDAGVALKSDGSVWTWGKNDRGQLGNGTTTSSGTPSKVTTLSGKVTAIAAGLAFVLVLKSDGTVWGWGDDFQGQLGDGGNTDKPTPVKVQGLTARVVAIAAGKAHSLAIQADGAVWSWGDNGSGALGTQTPDVFQNTPVRVQGFSGRAIGIAAGLDHSAAIRSDGSLWWWGREFVPSGDYMGTDEPAPMAGLSNVKQVLGGWDFFVALESNGSVSSWGYNLGDLGNGDGQSSLTDPVLVTGMESGVVAIGIGVENGFAITSKGLVWSWGNNNHGELGNGKADPEGGSLSPVVVSF
jgi:alpha-tubulin suppressor-like RCC1 family protein